MGCQTKLVWGGEISQNLAHIRQMVLTLLQCTIIASFLCFDNNKKAQLTLTNPLDAKACKIALIRRLSFHFTEFHFPEFQITDA